MRLISITPATHFFYVSDTENNYFKVFDSAGKFLRNFTAPGQFCVLSGFAETSIFWSVITTMIVSRYALYMENTSQSSEIQGKKQVNSLVLTLLLFSLVAKLWLQTREMVEFTSSHRSSKPFEPREDKMMF